MCQQWNLQQLTGYLGTWSAVKRYDKERGINPVVKLSNELAHVWGSAEEKLSVSWPLTVRVRKKNS